MGILTNTLIYLIIFSIYTCIRVKVFIVIRVLNEFKYDSTKKSNRRFITINY